MAGASVRRPIPAVVFILLLSLLSAIVWYRVLNRSPASTPQAKAPVTSTCVKKPTAKATKAATKTPAKAKPVAWPAASAVHVSVLNGTQRNGLAKSVASQLRTRGFKIGTITNDPTGPFAATQVRYGTTMATAAKLIQLYLPGSKLVPNKGKAVTVVVSLGTSYRHLSTNAAVAKAKKTAAIPAVTC